VVAARAHPTRCPAYETTESEGEPTILRDGAGDGSEGVEMILGRPRRQ
jgi:hypothetical protein